MTEVTGPEQSAEPAAPVRERRGSVWLGVFLGLLPMAAAGGSTWS